MSDEIFDVQRRLRRLERALAALIEGLGNNFHSDGCHSREEPDAHSRECSCGAALMDAAAKAAEECMP